VRVRLGACGAVLVRDGVEAMVAIVLGRAVVDKGALRCGASGDSAVVGSAVLDAAERAAEGEGIVAAGIPALLSVTDAWPQPDPRAIHESSATAAPTKRIDEPIRAPRRSPVLGPVYPRTT